MGLNVNLQHMLGLPKSATCPHCGKETSTWDDDYDIEDDDTNPQPGVWVLMRSCEHCEHEWKQPYQVSATPIVAQKP